MFKKSAVSVVDALHNIADPREQMNTQKRISKSLVDTISEIDGFRYSFHNNWLSNADQANRFSYYCNDSVLNKGRAANEGLAKIRCGVKSRKPVYECAGGIWIKFSLTKNNLQLDYKHIPMHPTFEETAPLPRNGSKRRKLWEIFHPEKLPQHRRRASDDKSDPQEKARKRKSTDEPKTLGRRKRKAAEPITQGDNASAPQRSHGREISLQPLFDFLGSPGRPEDAGVGIREADISADCDGGSAPPPLREGVEAVVESRNAASPSDKPTRHPGAMTVSMTHDETTQGSKIKPKKKSSHPSNGQPSEESPTAPILATAAPFRRSPAVTQEGNGLALASASSAEIDALRRRLIEAEEKIRLLESQKQQPPQPPRPAQPDIVQQPPPPTPPTQAHYAPTQYPHHSPPSPQVRWQHRPPGRPDYPPYPYQYPRDDSSQPPPPPPPAHAATLPQPYHQARQRLPPPVPNPSPSYVFVPNPAELFTTKVRPHLVPSRSQSMHGPGPIHPTPPALHNNDHAPELNNYTASPSHTQSSAPSQSQGQSQSPTSSRPQTQTPVLDTN
ncbi:hypothetical protein, variant [Phialophora macrospora]|nr:hypothetical protein, variant [Phialophora macrospora]